jgi:hypothetical protein
MEVRPKPPAALGPVLRTAWGVTRGNLVTIIVMTILVATPINAILELVPISEDAGLKEWNRYFKWQRTLQFWIGTIGTLGVVHVTVAAHRGTRLSIGDAFVRAFGSYGSALWAQFLYNLACVLGLLLFVVPGVALAVYWFFSLQAIVADERPGLDALNQSRRTVRGRWWSFFWRITALYLFMILGMVILAVPAVFLPESYVVGIVATIPLDLLAAFFTVAFTELYLMSGPEIALDANPAAPTGATLLANAMELQSDRPSTGQNTSDRTTPLPAMGMGRPRRSMMVVSGSMPSE